MNFDQADTGIIVLLSILGISILIAIIVIAKTITNEAKEKKEKSAQLAADQLTEEKSRLHEPKVAAQAKPEKTKPAAPVHKDDVTEDDDLVAAAEVYLTYELKEQAITSLEKHLLTNPTDKKALALLKKAEASD